MSLHLDVLPQVSWDIEVFALDDCRFAFFKTTACDGFKLQDFLLCVCLCFFRERFSSFDGIDLWWG